MSIACIAREMQEEISYSVAPDRFELFLTTTLDEMRRGCWGQVVPGYVFPVEEIPSDDIVVTEGPLAIVDLAR